MVFAFGPGFLDFVMFALFWPCCLEFAICACNAFGFGPIAMLLLLPLWMNTNDKPISDISYPAEQTEQTRIRAGQHIFFHLFVSVCCWSVGIGDVSLASWDDAREKVVHLCNSFPTITGPSRALLIRRNVGRTQLACKHVPHPDYDHVLHHRLRELGCTCPPTPSRTSLTAIP